MKQCNKCREYFFKTTTCRCELFIVIDEDGEEHNIYANYEEEAAEKFAEQYNDEGDLMNDSIKVTINGNKYIVGAETDVHYWVRKDDNVLKDFLKNK